MVMSTSVAEVTAMSNKELSRFAAMKVDYLDFSDDPSNITQALIKRITNAGLLIGDPNDPTRGDDSFLGTDFDDEINTLAGVDELFGNDGNDTLTGGKGNDFVFGGAGDDVIDGGRGKDWLGGDGGADRFVFRADASRDYILDFNAADGAEHDVIDLSGIKGISEFSDLKFIEARWYLKVIVSDTVTIRMQNVDIDLMDATDFIF